MGDGFPATYDTPEHQEEYKNFYLQCFNNFLEKPIKMKQNANNSSVRKCKLSKKDYLLYPSCRNNRIWKPEGKQYITEVYPQIPWAITLLWQSNRTVGFDRRIQRTLRKDQFQPWVWQLALYRRHGSKTGYQLSVSNVLVCHTLSGSRVYSPVKQVRWR